MENNKTKLPIDFNWKEYVNINCDIKNIKEEEEAIKHYLEYGIKEKRKYKIDRKLIPHDFNWKNYVLLNKDLTNVENNIQAMVHYINFGIKENRIYKLYNNESKINNIPKLDLGKNKLKLKIQVLDNDNIVDYIEENNILKTRQFHKVDPNFLKYETDSLIFNEINSFVLVIDFNNGGGGTTIFLNRIISKYKNYNTFLVLRYNGTKYTLNINEEYNLLIELKNLNDVIHFLDKYKFKCSKIFVNHFLDFNKEFIDYILDLNIYKIGITHDYYNIFDKPQPLFKEIDTPILNKNININKFDLIITQNKSNIKYFEKYYFGKMIVVDIPDFKFREKKITTKSDTINCCVIGDINYIKGGDMLEKIINYFKHKNKNIKFFVIGNCYNKLCESKTYTSINEFNNLLIEYKINLILELSIWPETYSFTLTLSMITDLPIIYLKKPNKSVIKRRLKKYDKFFEFEYIHELEKIIIKNQQNYFYLVKPTICYNKFWNDLFIEKKKFNIVKNINNINNKFKYDIKPYFIYFPQFHEFYENNLNFYKGFTDMTNLQQFNDNTACKKEIPLNDYCEIGKYNYLKNDKLVQKQIELINYYGFSGLAIYYYWFSLNGYTNKNMIMGNIIDKFFSNEVNMLNTKIFFIWANEDWSGNPALVANSNNIKCSHSKTIMNIYDNEYFEKNGKNLIKYFKHNNYLKIKNKPVFFVYHDFLIPNIDVFFNILNNLCIENNFDGVHLVLNSFEKNYDNYKNFYINFNYKKYESRFVDKNDDNQIKLDYYKYINDPYHTQNNKIQTIVYDFDNRARLYIPNQLNKSTICINNTEICKRTFTKKIIDSYKDYENSDNELDKILLINALNEWGESMAFEPSDKYGYYNINLLYNCLRL